jgi:hypothetical protein
MSVEFYRDLASDAAYRADQAAIRAAEAADRAHMLGPESVAAELSGNEARIASSCAETAHNAASRASMAVDVEDARKWSKVAQYAADKAEDAAEDAHRFASDRSLYY